MSSVSDEISFVLEEELVEISNDNLGYLLDEQDAVLIDRNDLEAIRVNSGDGIWGQTLSQVLDGSHLQAIDVFEQRTAAGTRVRVDYMKESYNGAIMEFYKTSAGSVGVLVDLEVSAGREVKGFLAKFAPEFYLL